DPQYLEWNKFSRMISPEQINYEELSNYVDSINTSSNAFTTNFEKKELPFMRKRTGEDPGPSHN
ncbi:MAG: hypothetical protein KDD45_08315, partial [Bdellovibrionales bacterium]|nr:hypothetical protein [Bdellovibrionales bacterium]